MKKDYSEYTTNAEVGIPVRHGTCPFCGTTVKSKGFVVTKTNSGYLMWCHKCHGKKFLRNGASDNMFPAYSECIARGKKFKENKQLEQLFITNTTVNLPHDMTTDIPVCAKLWLDKYNVTQDEIATFKIGFSPKWMRLILPVYDENNTLQYWQGRYFGSLEAPKYFNVRSTSRSDVWFDTLTSTGVDSDVIVIVEDIISAIAISRCGYRAIALLGSYLLDGVTSMLVHLTSLSEDRQVRVWLDPDKRSECSKYAKRLRAFGISAKAILKPDKDPKEYSPEEIRRFVCGKR